jgi:hypothetical protein
MVKEALANSTSQNKIIPSPSKLSGKITAFSKSMTKENNLF